MSHRTRLLAFTLAVACAAVPLMRVRVSAQEVTAPALKAAYIYNFAKFTEWPGDLVPATEPLVMCVLGDAAVEDALGRAVRGRMVAGHSMSVTAIATVGPQRTCHVLYVSGMTPEEAAQFVARLRDLPVLTISDMEGFTQLGGIVQFYFDRGQLRFGVRVASATRARLLISSKLLALARIQ